MLPAAGPPWNPRSVAVSRAQLVALHHHMIQDPCWYLVLSWSPCTIHMIQDPGWYLVLSCSPCTII